MSDKPIIAITKGDPAGVGPEITLKALATDAVWEACIPAVVGYEGVFARAAGEVAARAAASGAPATCLPLVRLDSTSGLSPGERALWLVEPKALCLEALPKGVPSALGGEASYRCVEKAVRLVQSGKAAAVVTNPLSKFAMSLAGHRHEGHTELIRDLTGSAETVMMLCAGSLRVAHVTTHCSLAEVAARCTVTRELSTIRLLHQTIRRLGISAPRIVVCGLNPHADESGMFGAEDAGPIAEACEVARAEGMLIDGPKPADTVFPMALGGAYDGVVAQYHDQGHVPVKMAGFKYSAESGQWVSISGVNVTLGLPIVRTSVDHGTGYEVAGLGKALATSLVEAILLAANMIGESPM